MINETLTSKQLINDLEIERMSGRERKRESEGEMERNGEAMEKGGTKGERERERESLCLEKEVSVVSFPNPQLMFSPMH